MLALHLAVFCLVFCGSYGFTRHFFNFFNHCNPPETLVGKFCAVTFDNDVYEDDDVINNRDFNNDMILYNYDDNLCEVTRADVVQQWVCRYGWSVNYGHFIFDFFDTNNDGVVTFEGDWSAPMTIPKAGFLRGEYNRFNEYCSVPANRDNDIDRVLCAEVEALNPDDIKC